MAFTDLTTPNITDFWTFLDTSVQIPTSALPANSVWPQYALNQILDLILQPPGGSGLLLCLAAYNGATHILLSITPDQSGQTYFADARGNGPSGFNLVNPSTGIVQASSDQSTSQSLATPDWAKMMTVGDLDFYKTPWGRYFLNWQQSYGPTIWGLV